MQRAQNRMIPVNLVFWTDMKNLVQDKFSDDYHRKY